VGKLPKQTKRNQVIKRFRELRFKGPYQGTGDHPQFMERQGRVVKMPNPHRADIGEGLLKKLLAEAGISVEEWLGEKKSTPESPEKLEESARASQPRRSRERSARRAAPPG
jgi:predicted RNA binding protein YcfA (HicA-like mRNA interferase family)